MPPGFVWVDLNVLRKTPRPTQWGRPPLAPLVGGGPPGPLRMPFFSRRADCTAFFFVNPDSVIAPLGGVAWSIPVPSPIFGPNKGSPPLGLIFPPVKLGRGLVFFTFPATLCRPVGPGCPAMAPPCQILRILVSNSILQTIFPSFFLWRPFSPRHNPEFFLKQPPLRKLVLPLPAPALAAWRLATGPLGFWRRNGAGRARCRVAPLKWAKCGFRDKIPAPRPGRGAPSAGRSPVIRSQTGALGPSALVPFGPPSDL